MRTHADTRRHTITSLFSVLEACTLRFAGQRLTSFDHLALVAEAHIRNTDRAEPLGLGPQHASSKATATLSALKYLKSFSNPWPLLQALINQSSRAAAAGRRPRMRLWHQVAGIDWVHRFSVWGLQGFKGQPV